MYVCCICVHALGKEVVCTNLAVEFSVILAFFFYRMSEASISTIEYAREAVEGTEEWEVESLPVHAPSDREMEEEKVPESRPHTPPPDLRPTIRWGRPKKRRWASMERRSQEEEVDLQGEAQEEEVVGLPLDLCNFFCCRYNPHTVIYCQECS